MYKMEGVEDDGSLDGMVMLGDKISLDLVSWFNGNMDWMVALGCNNNVEVLVAWGLS